MAVTDPNQALHYSGNKSGVDQIPPEVLLEVGDVYTYGEEKYARDNWLKGNNWSEFNGSALRHLFSFATGEINDPESGLPHLAHAIWNLIALRTYQIHGLGKNNLLTADRAVDCFDGTLEDTGQEQSLVETLAAEQRETVKKWY